MAERLTDDVGLQLLANTAAIGVLYAVILMFGEISGAHSTRRSPSPSSCCRSGHGSTSARMSQPTSAVPSA